ncbi:MAG: hypothetical protein H5U05_08215 [Candidatus Aminicenantes bacterium]|nr:hypothetical protein [Candidatus Aminicenantes bacterium]
MKKALAVTLTALVIFSTLSLIPLAGQTENPADSCWNNWERCRARALASDLGVIRTTLALTLCDIALGNCLMKII